MGRRQVKSSPEAAVAVGRSCVCGRGELTKPPGSNPELLGIAICPGQAPSLSAPFAKWDKVVMKTGPILVRLLETQQTHRRRCACCCSLALSLLPPGTLRAPGSPAAGCSPSNLGGFPPALAVAEEEERDRSGLPTCLLAVRQLGGLGLDVLTTQARETAGPGEGLRQEAAAAGRRLAAAQEQALSQGLPRIPVPTDTAAHTPPCPAPLPHQPARLGLCPPP